MSAPLGTVPPPSPQVRRQRLRPSGGGRPTPPSCGPREPRQAGRRTRHPTRERTTTANSHLGPGGSGAASCPAAPRRGLKSLTPPAPPSVLSAHWPPPAPPMPAPARFIGPFESSQLRRVLPALLRRPGCTGEGGRSARPAAAAVAPVRALGGCGPSRAWRRYRWRHEAAVPGPLNPSPFA